MPEGRAVSSATVTRWRGRWSRQLAGYGGDGAASRLFTHGMTCAVDRDLSAVALHAAEY
jgi:hypothetical protein